jgi:hypothetical protein
MSRIEGGPSVPRRMPDVAETNSLIARGHRIDGPLVPCESRVEGLLTVKPAGSQTSGRTARRPSPTQAAGTCRSKPWNTALAVGAFRIHVGVGGAADAQVAIVADLARRHYREVQREPGRSAASSPTVRPSVPATHQCRTRSSVYADVLVHALTGSYGVLVTLSPTEST